MKENLFADMEYDGKTFLSNMSLKRIIVSKNLFMFVRPIIEQTKVHFKILELLIACYYVWYGALTSCRTSAVNDSGQFTEMSGVHQLLLENAFSRTRTHMSCCVSG